MEYVEKLRLILTSLGPSATLETLPVQSLRDLKRSLATFGAASGQSVILIYFLATVSPSIRVSDDNV
jgi:hypothetical protein